MLIGRGTGWKVVLRDRVGRDVPLSAVRMPAGCLVVDYVASAVEAAIHDITTCRSKNLWKKLHRSCLLSAVCSTTFSLLYLTGWLSYCCMSYITMQRTFSYHWIICDITHVCIWQSSFNFCSASCQVVGWVKKASKFFEKKLQANLN